MKTIPFPAVAFLHEYLSFWDEAERIYSYFILFFFSFTEDKTKNVTNMFFPKNSLVEFLLHFFNIFFLFLG